MPFLCRLGLHRWQRKLEWHTCGGTFLGGKWPWPVTIPIRFEVCRRCPARRGDEAPETVSVSKDWLGRE